MSERITTLPVAPAPPTTKAQPRVTSDEAFREHLDALTPSGPTKRTDQAEAKPSKDPRPTDSEKPRDESAPATETESSDAAANPREDGRPGDAEPSEDASDQTIVVEASATADAVTIEVIDATPGEAQAIEIDTTVDTTSEVVVADPTNPLPIEHEAASQSEVIVQAPETDNASLPTTPVEETVAPPTDEHAVASSFTVDTSTTDDDAPSATSAPEIASELVTTEDTVDQTVATTEATATAPYAGQPNAAAQAQKQPTVAEAKTESDSERSEETDGSAPEIKPAAPVATTAIEPTGATLNEATEQTEATVDAPTERSAPIGEQPTPHDPLTESAATERQETQRPAIDPARFVSRVAGAFEAAQRRGGGPIEIRLSPPELGTMQLKLEVREGVLTASIETENHAARNALLDNLPALRERLAEQEIRVEKFDVDVRQDSGQSQAEPDRDAHNRRREEPGEGRQAEPQPEGAEERRVARSTIDLSDGSINLVA